ncbi:MAG: MBL fold metallo-hydrolase [Clostridia bacterium]|nr:MBL fold metallo-hydrolase [Clostridia bacterium]
MKIISICPQSFASNCYALISGGKALVVDPSVSADAIISKVIAENAVIEGILLTHGHFDHIISLDTLRKYAGVEAYIHESDAPMLTDGRKNAFYTFFGQDRAYAPAEHLLTNGEEISLGDEKIKVIHTSGHSPGSVCYLCGDIMVTGDTLFADTIGRCDLWGGSDTEILASLELLRKYDRKITIYPGHGPSATLGNALDNAAYYI